jgi:16S rRNA processing protein RimM
LQGTNALNRMNKKELFNFGYILKTNGFKGHVVIMMDVDSTEKYKKLDSIILESVDNLLTSYKIIQYELNKNKTSTVLLEGIDSFDKAQPLLKNKVYLPLSFLPPLDARSFYFHEIPGFTVIDKTCGDIGIAECIIESAQQNILQVKKEKTEILIPLKNEFIISIDRTKRILNIDAPEGLIEMYLDRNENEEEEFDGDAFKDDEE